MTSNPGVLSRLKPHILVWLLYTGVAVIITWPGVTSLSTQFLGGDTSDAYEMARHIWWFKYALQNGEPLFWQTNLGYPDGFSGVSLQANPLQFFPAWALAFVLPLASAYNLTILMTMGLNGWAVWYAARELLPDDGGAAPALLAGLVFMAFPTFQGHLFDGHAGLMVMWPVPLYTLALFRLVKTHSPRWFVAGVIFFLLSPTGHMLQVFYVMLPITAVFWLALIYRRQYRSAAIITVMSIISSTLLLLFLLPLIFETFQSAAYTETQGYVRYSADLLGIVSPSFLHPVYGSLLDYPRRVLGTNLAEGSTYVGIVGGLLALIGALRFRAARWWLLLAVTAWLLSLGPLLKIFDAPVHLQFEEYETYIVLPWGLVQNLPGFNLARTPGRFTFTLALAVAMLAGYGAVYLWMRQPRLLSDAKLRGAAVVVVGAVVLLDYQFFWPVPSQPADIPQAVSMLRQRDDVRAVFNVPYEHLLAAKDALYLQTAHEKPLIAGQVTRQTPVNPAKLHVLQATLDPALLHEAGADLVIFHRQRAAEIGMAESLQARLQDNLGTPIYEDARLAIYETPPVSASSAATFIAERAEVTDTYSAYLYVPEPGLYAFRGRVRAEGRVVTLLLDDTPLQRYEVDGVYDLFAPLPITAPGYYSIRLALEPPCPVLHADTLRCHMLDVEAHLDLVPVPLGEPVQFEHGITLAGYGPPRISGAVGRTALAVDLWWQFDQLPAETDVRFVHLLNADDEIEAQSDLSPVQMRRIAGEHYAEVVVLGLLEDIPPGEYTLRVGWYDYNTLTNYPVTSGEAAGAAAYIIGDITLP